MDLYTRPPTKNSEAFNQGCDARLNGWPQSDNPYDQTTDHHRFHQWKLGWLDVDQHWGKWEGRKPPKPLPRVGRSF